MKCKTKKSISDREKQLSSKVIIQIMGNNTSIRKVGFQILVFPNNPPYCSYWTFYYNGLCNWTFSLPVLLQVMSWRCFHTTSHMIQLTKEAPPLHPRRRYSPVLYRYITYTKGNCMLIYNGGNHVFNQFPPCFRFIKTWVLMCWKLRLKVSMPAFLPMAKQAQGNLTPWWAMQ